MEKMAITLPLTPPHLSLSPQQIKPILWRPTCYHNFQSKVYLHGKIKATFCHPAEKKYESCPLASY